MLYNSRQTVGKESSAARGGEGPPCEAEEDCRPPGTDENQGREERVDATRTLRTGGPPARRYTPSEHGSWKDLTIILSGV
jgi:hypothetical protein